MRDIILVGWLCVAIYFCFRKPFLGVVAWTWVALMAPAKWAFGFSQEFRVNLTIVVVSVISYLFHKNKPDFRLTNLHVWVFLFLFWMLISTYFHIQIDDAFIWEKFSEFTKIVALFLFVTLTVRSRNQVEAVIWAIVLAVSAYAAMEAVKFIISGGSHRITGKAGIIADRNDLAVAINMCLPFLLYLFWATKTKVLKVGIGVLFLLNLLAIIGTYSRGGFVGIMILLFAIWLSSNKKLIIALVVALAIPVLIENAPKEWVERQNTLETAATEDGSFIGRLWAWKIATLIAIDNPFTGGGFKATTDPLLWSYYAPYTPQFGPIATPEIRDYIKPKAAHNIYFQVLANAGFVGLAIFLILLLKTLLRSLKNVKVAKASNMEWCYYLSRAIILSFVGYGITGINVSLAYFELVYIIIALVIVIGIHMQENQKVNQIS